MSESKLTPQVKIMVMNNEERGYTIKNHAELVAAGLLKDGGKDSKGVPAYNVKKAYMAKQCDQMLDDMIAAGFGDFSLV